MIDYCNFCKKMKRVLEYKSYIDEKNNIIEDIILSCKHKKKYINFDEV